MILNVFLAEANVIYQLKYSAHSISDDSIFVSIEDFVDRLVVRSLWVKRCKNIVYTYKEINMEILLFIWVKIFQKNKQNKFNSWSS